MESQIFFFTHFYYILLQDKVKNNQKMFAHLAARAIFVSPPIFLFLTKTAFWTKSVYYFQLIMGIKKITHFYLVFF
jgi:hypothetical protein